MESKSNGQKMLERVEKFVGRYIHFADSTVENQALVVALWAIHTWLYERFTTTPYLAITAATKQAGKTLLMEVLGMITRGSHLLATVRALMVCRMIEAYEGRLTLYFDEAEIMGKSAVGDARAIMASGYRAGGKHGVTVGKSFQEFSVYCPKAFALIGDLQDVLRDRSIVVQLERGKPVADLAVERGEAEGEAAAIQADIRAAFTEVPAYVQPEFLQGRDREIWSVMWSIALSLKLDKATMKRLEIAMTDLCGLKSAPRREYHRAQVEADTLEADYAERAINDLRSVLRDGEKGVWSAVAVERMKAIPTAPWRTFAGTGLNENKLASLVSRFGVQPRNIRVGGRAGKVQRGYTRADILASVPAKGEASEA